MSAIRRVFTVGIRITDMNNIFRQFRFLVASIECHPSCLHSVAFWAAACDNFIVEIMLLVMNTKIKIVWLMLCTGQYVASSFRKCNNIPAVGVRTLDVASQNVFIFDSSACLVSAPGASLVCVRTIRDFDLILLICLLCTGRCTGRWLDR